MPFCRCRFGGLVLLNTILGPACFVLSVLLFASSARAEPTEAPTPVELPDTAVTDGDPNDPEADNEEAQAIAALRTLEEEMQRPELPYGWSYEFVELFKVLSLNYTGRKYQDEPIHYRLFVPDMDKASEKFPLIVWLHGYGQRGSNNLRHLRFLDQTIFREPKDRGKYKFFLLAVQCPKDNSHWTTNSDEADDMMDVATAVLDQTIRDYPVDETRITLCGISSGGTGCWEMAMRNPDRFAGVAPLAGGGADLSRINQLVGVPVWAFHNIRDRMTPIDGVRENVQALQAAGGNAYLTEINAGGHGGWIAAYRDYDLLEWLLSQQKGAWFTPRPGDISWSRWWNEKVDNSYAYITSLTAREAALQFGVPAIILVAFLSAWRQRNRRRRARLKTGVSFDRGLARHDSRFKWKLPIMNRVVRLETAALVVVALGLLGFWVARPIPYSLDLSADTSVLGTPQQPEVVPKVDLRSKFKKLGLRPRKQGRRDTCSVFTTTGAIEFALSRRLKEPTPLSVEYLNWACNQVIDNREDSGQFFHDLIAGFEQHGICLDAEMGYERRFDPDLVPTPEAIASAQRIRGYGFEFHWIKRLESSPGLSMEQFEEVKSVLRSGLPVAAGASHSRLFVGFIDDPNEQGGGILLTKDSGEGAFSTVNYEFAKTEVNDAFWVDLTEDSPPETPH